MSWKHIIKPKRKSNQEVESFFIYSSENFFGTLRKIYTGFWGECHIYVSLNNFLWVFYKEYLGSVLCRESLFMMAQKTFQSILRIKFEQRSEVRITL